MIDNRSVIYSVNLASFVFDRPAKCKGKVDASNFY